MLTSQSTQRFLSSFKDLYGNGRGGPGWLKTLRQSAIGSFERLGFPTTHDEEWKYTSVEPITSELFATAPRRADGANVEAILSRSFADAECSRLVFVDGVWTPHLSSWRQAPEGVRVVSLAAAIEKGDPILGSALAASARHEREAFVALNTAFMEDGAVVVVPPRTRLESAVHLVFASVAAERPVALYPRNLIVVGAGSEIKIVESHVGLGNAKYFVDAVTEVVGEEAAVIDYYRLQRENDAAFHIGAVDARLGRNSRLTAHAITLAGGLVRNDIHVALDGEGSECALNGIYLLDGNQHVDNHTEIEHLRPRATSFELYKGILSGSARAIFNGKIIVHKDAQKTNARQVNKNLLLSQGATVNTKPQLEIYADDVKCNHGSTIGQIDADALFYLRSRGMDVHEAQRLLSYAFASDVVARMGLANFRSRMDAYLLDRFGKSGNPED